MTKPTTPVILLGYGGNVIDVIDMIDDINDVGDAKYEVLGFMDNRDELQGQTLHGYPMLGKHADAPRFLERHPDVRFTTWISRIDTYHRRPSVLGALGELGVTPERFLTLVHPTTYVSRRAKIGRGALIFQNCTISNSATVGDHVVILPNSILSHDNVIGDYAVVTSGCDVGSDVKVGRNAYLGTHCAIHPGRTVGEGALIGMGAVVIRDVAPYTVVVGNPARVLRDASRP